MLRLLKRWIQAQPIQAIKVLLIPEVALFQFVPLVGRLIRDNAIETREYVLNVVKLATC